MRSLVVRMIAAALAAALVLTGCTGVQTQTGEPETTSSTTATQAPSGSEEAQPQAGEETTADEQPGAVPPTSSP